MVPFWIGSALASSLISSVLWPGHNQLSELASRLIVAYADLGEVRALFAPFALENVKAVLDTEHLLGRAAQHYRCSISRQDANRVYLEIGATGERDLRDIQALAKEITFFVRPENQIAHCISELDLLDFPVPFYKINILGWIRGTPP